MAFLYDTWNPLDKDSNIVLSNGNLSAQRAGTGSGWFTLRSTQGKNSGKWYVEFIFDFQEVYVAAGISPPGTALNYYLGSSTVANSWGWLDQATQVRYNNGTVASSMAATVGDIIGLAIDLDNNKLYYSKNGSWAWGSQAGDPVAGTGGISISSRTTDMYLAGSVSNYNECRLNLNAGQSTFSYSVPEGYNAGWYEIIIENVYTGHVYQNGLPVSKKVRIYDTETGNLQDETTSSGTNGYYSLSTVISGSHYVVCLDDDESSYNHQIIKNVIPDYTT